MQPIRHRIVEILKENGTATVAELAVELDMAQVSVRHHLDILIGEDLVEASGVRRRDGAGRPSQIYCLAPGAAKLFPQAHAMLADDMLREIKAMLSAAEIQGLFLRIAQKTARDAPLAMSYQSLEDRLDQVSAFLTQRGYTARWEARDGRYELYTCNCPFSGVAEQHPEVCAMDRILIQDLLSEAVQRGARQVDGAQRCTYVVEVDPASGAVGQ
jgi:predicted ArsR family transcriptional regulator